jgi:hypothetical protein
MTAVTTAQIDIDYENICFEASDFPSFTELYRTPMSLLTNAVTKTFLFAGQHGTKASVSLPSSV